MSIFRDFFKTQSDQNIHQTAPHFQNFLRAVSICPWTPQHMHATIIKYVFLHEFLNFLYKKLDWRQRGNILVL